MKKSTFVAMIPGTVSSVFFSLGMCNEIMMAKSKLIKANEKIAETVTGGYKKIEESVVDGYQKIEQGVVETYTRMEDKFIHRFLTREDESVADARERLKKEHVDKP